MVAGDQNDAFSRRSSEFLQHDVRSTFPIEDRKVISIT